jgi:photosystem II stability/assembly factor-like uncharacterized protein
MQKTYYVTRIFGQVRRLDNLTLPWVDVSISHPDGFLDVMSVPDEPEKVIVVGEAAGIYWSNDSGTTWTQAIGTYTDSLGKEYPEIWIVDNTTSYVAGGIGGHVFKSTDGGVTFNILASHPTPGGGEDGDTNTSAIHFISATTGVVCNSIGGQTTVWKTTDGGTSWVQLNGASILGLASAGGVHISADEQNIVVQTSYGAWRSTDAGATFIQTLDLTVDFVTGSGLHLTWVDDSTMWISGNGNTLRQSIDGGNTWSVIRAWNPVSGAIIGAHFYDANNGFIGQGGSIHSTTDAGLTTAVSETVAPPNAIWTGLPPVTPVDPCYTLTDCAGIAEPIFTGNDLADHVGTVISLTNEDGGEAEGCWFVNLNLIPCDEDVVVDVDVYKCYDDCESCLPEPEPIVVPKPRAVLPNYTTGTCDPAIIEKAFCKHAELIYRRTLAIRFKLEDCCPKDDMSIEMKYHKMAYLLCKKEDPTPDPCNPMCMAYEGFIQPGYSAVTTYTDCYGQEQIETLDITGSIQVISVCALNTNPPTVVISDSEENEVDTFTLSPIEDCP